jgi:hypothetical protein
MTTANELPIILDCILAAKVLGVSTQHVRDLCASGAFKRAIRLPIGWIIPSWEVTARSTTPLRKGGRPLGYRPKLRRRRRTIVVNGQRSRPRRSDLPPLLPREVAQAMAKRSVELSTPQERQKRARKGGLASAARMTPEQRQARARVGAAARAAKRRQQQRPLDPRRRM